MTDTNHINGQTWFKRLDAWEKQPQTKHRMRIVLLVECGVLACLWAFAWLVKYHHLFGLVWKS
jgi:hypothetical protein